MKRRVLSIIAGLSLIATAAIAGTVITGDITYTGNIAFTQPVTLSGGTIDTGNSQAAAFIPSGSTLPTNGLYLPAANNPGIAANSTKVFDCTTSRCKVTGGGLISAGLSIGGSVVQPGGLFINSSIGTPAASSVFLDYSGGTRLYSYGADASTNSAVTFTSLRSDGSNSIAYLVVDTSGNVTSASATWGLSSVLTAKSFIPSDTTIPTNGFYLPSANTPAIAANSLKAVQFTGGTNAFTMTAGTNPAIGTTAGNVSLGSTGGTTTLDDANLTITAAAPVVTNLATDATHTTRTVCQDTTSKALYFGSGASGICLGTSSMRFKHDITPFRGGLSVVRELRPVSFVYNKGYGDDGARKQMGLLAEDVAKIVPAMVGRDTQGRPNAVDYGALFPILINAVQELAAANDDLRREIAAMKRAGR